MSVVTFELVEAAGTDVAFELVAEPGTDVTFELLPGGSGGVTLPIDAEDVSVDVAGTPTPLDDVLTGLGAFVSSVNSTLGGQITDLQNGAAAEATTRGEADAELDSRIDAIEATVTTDGYAALIARRMAEQAARSTAPTKWAICGLSSDTVWATDFAIPTPTSTLTIETLVRVVGPMREPGFIEHIAESLDGTGDRDRFEVADWYPDTDDDGASDTAYSFAEGTAAGDTIEWQREGDSHTQLDNGALAPTVTGHWVRHKWVYNFAAHTITTSYEDDVYWDHEFHGMKWATIATYTNPGITSLADTAGYATWIGRSVAEYHQGHTHIWCDGTEVLKFEPDTAEIDDTTIYDSVAEIEGSPAAWIATDATVGGVTPSGSGADGASAYEVAVANGFVGDETAWLASLVGPQGDPGADGQDGADGANGSGETWAVNIDCTTAPHATTGTAPSITVNTASLNNGYLSTANSTGSGATFKRYFTAGTYDIKVRARNLGTSSGRGEVLVDGVSKGYFDTSVSTATNVLHTVVTGVSISEGAREITVASYDKGTGATSWTVLVQTIDLIRTA